MNFVGRALSIVLLAGVTACSFATEADSFGPVVVITSPNTQIVRGVAVFSADVSDDTGVARVRFLVDGVQLFEDTAAPFTTPWDTRTVADGPHLLRVEALDPSGNLGSISRSVQVSNAPPT